MSEKVINSKTEWIHSMFSVQEILEQITEDSRATFLTPFGLIVGEMCELKEYNFLDKEKISQQLKEDPKINPYALIESFFNQKEIDNDVKIEQKDRRIFLKNVNIYGSNNFHLKLDTFMIFVDHIIGVFPRGIDIK